MQNKNSEFYCIGIDVGGTNTDAVIIKKTLDEAGTKFTNEVIRSVKVPTTKDFTTGIKRAIVAVLTDAPVTEHQICAVMIGTTKFLNAVLENSSELSQVVVIRLCGPVTVEYPPFTGFPESIAQNLKAEYFFIDGGHEIDKVEIAGLSETQLRDAARKLAQVYTQKGTTLNVVLIGVFSPIVPDHEIKAKEILDDEFKLLGFTNYSITLSSKIGTTGFLERENACILNASLKQLAQKTIQELKTSVVSLGLINCENSVFLTQNDGTLMPCEEALEYPIFTFNSGPINSLRGAALLSEEKHALVADIGGTSTDIVVLENGFPRPSSAYVHIVGIRTNFRMADTVSIALGGGSVVEYDKEKQSCQVGPQSVGYELLKKAKSFNPDGVLTCSDIAIGLGHATNFEKPNPSWIGLEKEELKVVQKEIIRMLGEAVDYMKTSADDVPLILVGGGSILIPDNAQKEIPGVSKLIKPKNFDVANAIGATMAQVSHVIQDNRKFTSEEERDSILEELRQKAKAECIKKGAIESTIDYFVEDTQVAYSAHREANITVRAFGSIDFVSIAKDMKDLDAQSRISQTTIGQEKVEVFVAKPNSLRAPEHKFEFKEPIIVTNGKTKEWILSEEDVEFIAAGAAILGAGGGGSPYLQKLVVQQAIRNGKKIRVVRIDDLPDDEYTTASAYYGAPAAMIERLGGGKKLAESYKSITEFLGYKNKKVSSVTAAEIGGLNSLAPLYVGGELDIPVVDADFMGRAFPQLQMITPMIYGLDIFPITMCDDLGHEIILQKVPGGKVTRGEDFLRYNVVRFGCEAAISGITLKKKELQNYGVRNTVSRCWKLGRAIKLAKRDKVNPVKVIEEKEGGKLLFTGKIVALDSRTEGAYNKGKITLQGLFEGAGKGMLIEFQNENLVAYTYELATPKDKTVVAMVPDIISLIDTDYYQPILTEDLKYGLRVSVVALPCSPLLSTKEGLELVGPRAFGYTCDHQPLAGFKEPKSLLDG